jgi:hypothetical protein
MRIVAIDIGLFHLGLIQALVKIPSADIVNSIQVQLCNLVNVKELSTKCTNTDCKLRHDNIISDYMMHFFERYDPVFIESDYILIERQPPAGFVAIEQIIMYKYREKCVLISPVAMLHYFGFHKFDYDVRKEHTIEFATRYLKDMPDFINNERKHDLADALCMLYYFLDVVHKRIQQTSQVTRPGILSQLPNMRDYSALIQNIVIELNNAIEDLDEDPDEDPDEDYLN